MTALAAVTGRPAPQHRNETVVLDGHSVQVTEVFWSYWYLAAERQSMFMHRVQGDSGAATEDDILASHRFTNAYRASDRVSQYLLQHVIYGGTFDGPDTVFRVLLFKIFNRVETWEHIVSCLGEPTIEAFSLEQYNAVLDLRFYSDERLYSGAYIMPSPQLGHLRKHANHLGLLDNLVASGAIEEILASESLKDLYERLLDVPSFGPFLAFQYAIDLNYAPYFDFDEMDFVVPGPGALRGIGKCFTDTGDLSPGRLIRAMAEAAPQFFETEELDFVDLWGRPLQLIDCQNLFCEVDKYARVAHPEVGPGGPSRIKQTYTPNHRPLTLGYPPKWGLPWDATKPRKFDASETANLSTASSRQLSH